MIRIPIVSFNDADDGEPASALEHGKDHEVNFGRLREAQSRWASEPLQARLAVIREIRGALAAQASNLVRALSPSCEATAAEILSSQIIPLAEACRFLERNASSILRPGKRGALGRPLWLAGSAAEIRREPCGVVLLITPANYPLFLAGVSMVQALAAGNAVLIKPAPRCSVAIQALVDLCIGAGVPGDLISVLSENPEAVPQVIASGIDKVLFTGSARTGRRVLASLAPHLVPATLELSGLDAMFVLRDADLKLAARSLLFGLTLNEGATCIAPRRVFVDASRAQAFENEVVAESAGRAPWLFNGPNAPTVAQLVVRACAAGARLLLGEVNHQGLVTAPLVLADADPAMMIMQQDHFGPAAAVATFSTEEEALRLNEQCSYALGASIFSRDEARARRLAGQVRAGTVLINDVIVPTADARLPFGGRGESGFGVTRGAEGLLDLTVPKVVIRRQGKWRPHLKPVSGADAELLDGYLKCAHGIGWRHRLRAAWNLVTAAQRRKGS